MRGGFQYGGAAAGEELNLGMIGRAIWRHKLLIIGPTLVVAAVAFIAASMITPRYKSEARVLIEVRENIFLRPEAEKAMTDRSTVDAETVTSQVQLILSRDLAREVIKELNLVDSPEFNAALREGSPLSVLRAIGILKDPMSMAPEERVLAAYYDRLTAYAVDKSRVIVIEFQSADPELAARAANLIAKRYLSLQQMAKQDQVRSAGQWLSGELEKLRGKVSEAEAKVEDFRAKSNLYVGANNTSLTNQQLTELSSQVSAARAQKADAEARARSIRDALSSGRSLDSADVANSELIRRLSEQRVTLKAQLAEQSSTLLPQHPRIKEMKAQIADLEQQIRTEGDRIARAFEREAKIAGVRLETSSTNLDQFKRQTASTSDQDVQLRALEREAKAQRDLFESYLAKFRETTARDSISAAPADARIISGAVVSNIPYFPKKVPITLIAALGTFCLAAAFVVTSALLNGENYRHARRKSDAEAVPVARPVDARTRASDRLSTASELPSIETPPVAPVLAPQASDISTHAGDRFSAAPDLPRAETPSVAPVSAPQPTDTKARANDRFSAASELPSSETPSVAPVFAPQPTDTKARAGDRFSAASELPSSETPPVAPVFAPPPADTKARAGDRFSAASELPSAETPPVAPESALQDVDTSDQDRPRDASDLLGPEIPPAEPAYAPQLASTSIDDVIAALEEAGEAGSRVAVIGSARKIGTTLTAIALARTLSRTNRVVLVDLAFASQNVNAAGEEPGARGLADLARGEASFSDIIIRDTGSRAHLVAAGRVGADADSLLQSQVLWDAVEALAQSYDYLVLDAGAQAETAPDVVAATAPYAVLVCGDTPVAAVGELAGRLRQAGFAHVAIMAGSPPALEEAAAQSAA